MIRETVDPADIIHRDTTQHWNAQRTLVSKAGHIYIYTDKETVDGRNIPGIKIGDGLAYLIDMPFIDTTENTQPGSEYWNKKVKCFLSQGENENLVFTKN